MAHINGSNVSDDFNNELNQIQLRMPGSGGNEIPFSHNDALLDMVKKQYPHWRGLGNVTSVPIARIPKLFLRSNQMNKKLQKTFKGTQKGDVAEKKLYELFVRETFSNQPGIIVFPNFDGSELFKTQTAKVEIDMILVHQSKGIFIFNVKNVGGSSASSENIRSDIRKHRKLLRMLLNYNNANSERFIPIHAIVCNFSDKGRLYTDLDYERRDIGEQTLVLNKSQLTPETFKESWVSKLDQAGIKDVPWSSCLDILVARLISLSSLEGSLALIHEQIAKSITQAVSKSKHLIDQLENCKLDEDSKKHVVSLSKTTDHKRKEKFILWTNEQIRIIAKVYAHLKSPSPKGLRLLVAGCKGSGKTVLLTFLAQLAQLMKEESETKSKGNILVCDGSFSSPILHRQLKLILESTGIEVFSKTMSPRSFHQSRCFGGKHFSSLCSEFKLQLKNASFLLCDEYAQINKSILINNLREDQHCVLFSSRKESCEVQSFFEICCLSASLRSTTTLAEFANSWINFANLRRYDFECKKANNFEGEKVDIWVVKPDKNTTSDEHFQFTTLCVEAISEYAEKSYGMETLPIVPFLDPTVSELLIGKLKEKQYRVRNSEAFSDSHTSRSTATTSQRGTDVRTDQIVPEAGPLDLPCITFFETSEIEGSEFGVVIILIDIKHAENIPANAKHKFFCAITRATSKVVIILNETQLSGCKSYIIENGKSCPCIHNGAEKQFKWHMLSVSSSSSPQPSTILIGRKPDSSFVKSDSKNVLKDIPKINGISIYTGENEGTLLHINDIYMESDLEKLHQFGVRLLLLMPDFAKSRFIYKFYNKSALCLSAFCNKRQDMFLMAGMSHTRRDFDFCLIVDFCFQYSGMQIKTRKLDSNTWSNYDIFEPNDPHFCWKKWVEKGREVFRLGYTHRAFDIFRMSLTLLEKLYFSKIARAALRSAKKERMELSDLNFSVAEMFQNSALEDDDEDSYFSWPVASSNSFGYYIRKSLQHAMQGIWWNLCYELMYVRVKNILTIIIDNCETRMEILARLAKQKDHMLITAELDISWKFKQKMRGDEIQRMIDWPVLFAMSADSPEYQEIKDEFEKSVETYKTLISSGKRDEKEKEKLSQCRDLAILAANLSRESLKLTSGQLPESSEDEVSFWSVKQVVNEIGQIMDHPVRQAFEAWFWDPLVIDGYEALSAAVKKLQTIVDRFHRSVRNMNEELHLSECILVDHNRLSVRRKLSKERFVF